MNPDHSTSESDHYLTTPVRSQQSDERVQTICQLVIAMIAVAAAMYFLSAVMIPFVVALIFTFVLTPAIDFQVSRLRFPRWIAVTTTMIIGCAVLVLLAGIVVGAAAQLTSGAGDYEDKLDAMILRASDVLPLERLGLDVEGGIGSILEGSSEALGRVLTSTASALMSVVSNGVLVVIFMAFLIAGRSGEPPSESPSMWDEIELSIRQYVRTKTFVSGLTGAMVGILLSVLGVPYAMLFGVLAFMLNFIPSVGSIIATLLPIPVVFVEPSLGLVTQILAIALPGTVQIVVGNIIEPRIMGQSLDLHPVVVMLGLIFFGTLWGVMGMFLATPITASIKIALDRAEITRPLSELLAGRIRKPGAVV